MPVVSWIHNGRVLSSTSRLNMAKIFNNRSDTVLNFDGHGNAINFLNPFQLTNFHPKIYAQLAKVDENTLKLNLVLNNLNKDSEGEYICATYNYMGRFEKRIKVRIFGK